MNHELNKSPEQLIPADVEQATDVDSKPYVLDEAFFARIGGGLSTSGPNGTW